MPDHEKRFESMLFNHETSGRTDFRDGEIRAVPKTEYEFKSECVRIRPPPLKYIHTLMDWKVPNVPMDLYIKPKEVVCTNPRNVQQRYDYPNDFVRDNVQKTRPRLVMTPAICLDDLKDGARQKLIEDVYTTTTERTMRDAVALASSNTIRAPFPGAPAPANPITLPKLQLPYVSPEWRMDSVSWDSRQLRTHTNATKEFWLARTPRCQECKDTAAVMKLPRK